MPTIYSRLKREFPSFRKSFLAHRLKGNRRYGFLPHYLYFLDGIKEWPASNDIQRRILHAVSANCGVAWNEWREFRSAQAEVSAVFLVEVYLGGRVTALEGSRPGNLKKCDLIVDFGQDRYVFLEVKAQSGQQHGTTHPVSSQTSLFTPHGEENLASWLFDEKTSYITGVPMTPKCKDAASKGADVLLSMIDIFLFQSHDLTELGKYLAPDYCNLEAREFIRNDRRRLKERRLVPARLEANVIRVGADTTKKMRGLREIWLIDSSNFTNLVILRAADVEEIIPRAIIG